MIFQLLPIELVQAIHDGVLNPGELAGPASDKSLAGSLARVENRLRYGMIADVFDLSAAYAIAIARGHCFDDGNKRTAFRVMQVCLDLHGIVEPQGVPRMAATIIRAAQGLLDEGELAEWLRRHC